MGSARIDGYDALDDVREREQDVGRGVLGVGGSEDEGGGRHCPSSGCHTDFSGYFWPISPISLRKLSDVEGGQVCQS